MDWLRAKVERYTSYPSYPPAPKFPERDPNEPSYWNMKKILIGPKLVKEKEWPRDGDQPKPDDMESHDWRGVVRKNVIELPMPEPYTYGKRTDLNYFWFDTPDYADPFKKLWYAAKFFGLYGLIAAASYASIRKMECSLKVWAGLTRRIVVPFWITGMGASTSTLVMANLRGEKDDYWNYAFGGAMACAIHSSGKGYVSAVRTFLPLVGISVLFKHNAEINGNMWPTFNMRHMTGFLSGSSADKGIKSGDLRMGVRLCGIDGDPGRDVEVFPQS